ncbi:conserved hypothetical protein [Leishmania major strain Friedlin]|uniref:Uncharacterized protein n=1 Tax=Leishmania major TaxID=5664 RepID=Q4Q352_LEIMA|nr:conserved hypothetical protein [Leishmania major strain Friedlin]CAG9582024.1 Protein_of_unknown_function_(DUF3808)_-_putative [Leishmania major strain Friedlin]CAJ07861.1 conserved hypothetical protein [Leishmania major strain Friedlin]|eukprot:XP_001686246.1 conserved hypothetical protein [Leishmania major strain Friedlin]
MSQSAETSAPLAERHADPMDMEAVEEELDIVKLEQLDDEANLKVLSHSRAEVERLRNLTPEMIRDMDSHIEYAVDAFFANRIADSEAALRSRMSEDPLAVCGAGLIAFVRCGLSMEQAQADIALELLTRSSALATQVISSEKSMISRGFSKVFQRNKETKGNWLSAAEFRAKTMHAESQALRCFVFVFQQSVSALVKAGLALNRANTSYKSLYMELEHRYKAKYGSKETVKTSQHKPAAGEEGDSDVNSPVRSPSWLAARDASLEQSTALETLGLDRNSVHCVEFGLGAMKLALSILPDNVRAVLRFIGVEGNRQEGLKLVRQCFKSDTLLSPFAGALLLALYGMLPATSAFLVDSYLPIAHEVRTEALKKEKIRESILHLWLDGRIERLTRSVDLSISKLNNCLAITSNPQLLAAMPQLRDFVLYDQWFNYAIVHQWKRASRCLEILSNTSKWANAVYQYAQACCLEMLEIEWAEGIENPDGVLDFPLEDLNRILGSSEAKVELIFSDVSTREAIAETITQLYWAAAQRKPVTLGGKPNHNDQFVLKRMEEILVSCGITPSTVVAKKKLGEPLEPVPEGLIIRNIVPLPAYEKCLIAGIAHQYPAERKDKMVTLIDAYLLREPVHRNTPLSDYVASLQKGSNRETASRSLASSSNTTSVGSHVSREVGSPAASPSSHEPRASLPENYRLLSLCVCKSMLLANSESKKDRQAALEVIKAIQDTPQYKDRQWSLSYAQAFALYEKAYIAYRDKSLEAAESIMNQLHKQYDSAHYYMHAKMDLKAHLASYHLREERQARAAKLTK